MTSQTYTFDPGPGYLLHKFSDSELAPIWKEVNTIKESWAGQPANDSLAGNINKQFTLTQSVFYIENLVRPYIDEYITRFNFKPNIDLLAVPKPLSLNFAWVNYQQRCEFNPAHNHGGAISFVIWLQVPYTKIDELVAGPTANNSSVSGDFHFQYTDSLGNIRNHSLDVDRSKENYICVFPSQLSHVVYPFYSTSDLRISVAGNWRFAD